MLRFYHNLRPFHKGRESAFQMTTLRGELTSILTSSGTTATSQATAVSSTSII